jgi:hypothetical protein
MPSNQVVVLRDTSVAPYPEWPKTRLHLQWGYYVYEDGSPPQHGYRYMWSEDGRLKPLRGGARIPSWAFMQMLMRRAEEEGWGGLDEQTPGRSAA